MSWVVVHNWPKHQHYRDRRPTWIKDYTEQVDDEDYLALTPTARALLQDLRRIYALMDGVVRRDVVAHRTRMRLRSAHWKELSDAGFIELSASRPLALRYTRVREEKELETPKPPFQKKGASKSETEKQRRKAKAWIDNMLPHLEDVDLAYTIADEFHIDDQDIVADLIAYAQERMLGAPPSVNIHGGAGRRRKEIAP